MRWWSWYEVGQAQLAQVYQALLSGMDWLAWSEQQTQLLAQHSPEKLTVWRLAVHPVHLH